MGCKWKDIQSDEEVSDIYFIAENYDMPNLIASRLLPYADRDNKDSIGSDPWILSKSDVQTIIEIMTGGPNYNIHVDMPSSVGGMSAGFTYLGQMITHDVVPDSDNKSGFRQEVSPLLNLDSIYPQINKICESPILDTRGQFLVGTIGDKKANDFDLPRDERYKALIPEPRNDQNIIVAQLHVVWMNLHNKAISILEAGDSNDPNENYLYAKAFVTLIFQRLVVEDYLLTILHPQVYDLYFRQGLEFIYNSDEAKFTIPLEFSNAVFRFGHSMIRQSYILKIYGEPKTVGELFRSGQQIEEDLKIDWEKFFDLGRPKELLANAIDLRIATGLLRVPDLNRIVPRYQSYSDYQVDVAEGIRSQVYIKENEISKQQYESYQRFNFDPNLKKLSDNTLKDMGISVTSPPLGFENLVLADLNKSAYVPSGGDLLKLMWSGSGVLSGEGKHIYPRLHISSPPTYLKNMEFSSSILKKLPYLNARRAPLWLFTMREAEIYPFTDQLIRESVLPNPDGTRLGAVSSVIIAEVLSQSIRRASINIHQARTQKASKLGGLLDSYLMLLNDSPCLKMAHIFKFINN